MIEFRGGFSLGMQSGDSPEGRGQHYAMYPLLRRFSVLSAVALGVVAVAIVLIYRTIAIGELTRLTEAQNAVLTHAIANSIWPRIADHVARAENYPPEELANHPETRELAALIEDMTGDLPIAKVKVYGAGGLTVYSSEPSQIGSSEADSPEFAAALAGTVLSEHEHRYVLPDGRSIHVVESYVPIRTVGRSVDGVFEVYADVTEEMERIHWMGWKLSALLIAAFGALFVALRMVVSSGDRIIRKQYEILLQAGERSRRQNAELAEEVASRTRAESELRAARDAAEAGNRAKTEFLAHMSHELRTPLNAIIGFSEAILNESFGALRPARYRGYIRDIHRSGHHLLKLVNGVLDLAKIEAGRMEVEAEWFSLDELVGEAVRLVMVQVERNRDRLTVDVAPDVGEILSDPLKVKTVLLNVLGNAAKYTERGEICVTVRRDDSAERGEAVVIRVADTGPGIAPERIGGIFEEFARRSAVLANGVGGSGLGLSIAKSFCELLGGRIELASSPGAGTEVTMTFPAGPAEDIGSRAAAAQG